MHEGFGINIRAACEMRDERMNLRKEDWKNCCPSAKIKTKPLPHTMYKN